MNLDYLPEMIIVSFMRLQDVERAAAHSGDPSTWVYTGAALASQGTKQRSWTLIPQRVDFTVHVRNSIRHDESPANKYLPIFARKERLQKAREHYLQA